jgi:hypothetical protein
VREAVARAGDAVKKGQVWRAWTTATCASSARAWLAARAAGAAIP